MTRPIAAVGLVLFLASVGLAAGVGAADGSAIGTGDAFKSGSIPQAPHAFALKLKAGGQLDPGVSVNFAGQATHLGQFTASGEYDAAILYYRGTIVVSASDSLHCIVQFATGPGGDVQAVLGLNGGTGRYQDTQGQLVGPVSMDADSMFTMDLEGSVFFVNPTVSVTPCSQERGSYCHLTCGETTYGGGLCQEANGDVSAITVECCCCTDGWQRRSFIGL